MIVRRCLPHCTVLGDDMLCPDCGTVSEWETYDTELDRICAHVSDYNLDKQAPVTWEPWIDEMFDGGTRVLSGRFHGGRAREWYTAASIDALIARVFHRRRVGPLPTAWHAKGRVA